MFMAHVPLLALGNHFKEAFSEDRRLSGGRPAPQRQCLECFVCPFAHPALIPTKLQSSVPFAVLLECFFSIYFIQILVIYYLPDNSSPIKIYEFVLNPIFDYVSVYESSHESYIIQLNLAIALHNNNKTGHISLFLS